MSTALCPHHPRLAVATHTQVVVRSLTKYEMHNTYVAFERAVFRKLTLAYVLNTVLLPLAVGLLPIGITPAWYEEGGIASSAMSLIIAAGVGFCASQAVQPEALWRRHVASRYVLSQPQLDRLWAAPQLLFAETYASIAKSLALCLLYAPLWPPAYGLTAVLLFFAYFCYRVGVRYWYARPPPLNETLFDELRYWLLWLLIGHVLILYAVRSSARGGDTYYMLIHCIVLVAVCSLGFVAIRPRRARNLTNGVPYDRVETQAGMRVERYENPAAVVARRLRNLERGVCAAMGVNQKRAQAQGRRTSVATANKGVKLKVCRKQAHHSAQVAPASPGGAGELSAGARVRTALDPTQE